MNTTNQMQQELLRMSGQQTSMQSLIDSQNNQIDWMQGGGGQHSLASLGMQGNPMQSNGMLPSLTKTLDISSGRPFQLPSMGSLNQNGPHGQHLGLGGLGMQIPYSNFGGGGMMGGNMQANQLGGMGFGQQQMQGLQNQMLGMNQLQMFTQLGLPMPSQANQLGMMPPMDALSLMGQGGGQDFSSLVNKYSGQPLPSLSQMQGMGQMFPGSNNQGQFQLPSISSMSQGFLSGPGSNFSTYDPYQSMQHLNQQQLGLLSGMQQTQQRMALPGLGPQMDELSLMLSLQNQGAASMNQFQNYQKMQDFNYQRQQQLGNFNKYGQFQQRQQPRQQTTSIIDPNLIQQNDIIENDKNDPPVAPCIMDPGVYDLSWLLESHTESKDQILQCQYLTSDDIARAVASKHNVDQLYLVKWRGLSYAQSTWEPESVIRALFEERINDYNRFNRSLDQLQRDKLDNLIKNHKKMLRFTEKKYTGHGNKRIDPQQENILSLQEAKINRSLLNQKIIEIMGEAYYRVVQYSNESGIVPQFKKPHQKLKDYQVAGLNWLIRAWHEHRNVVLADEMGLGKTIMTLSLFDHLNKVYKLRGPYLILAPLTTLEHWKRIADEWTSLNSVLYYDPSSSEGRQEIRHWEWFYTDITYKGTVTQKQELYKFNILITSFEVFMSDLNPMLQEIPFIYIVVDEAHRLKNKQAKTLKLLKDHPCKRILLLTGTPVQNNTKELWTLLNYIEPEKFHNMELFLEQYGNLETFEQIQKLHTILKPHFLRRLKEEVENSIPPLNETVVEVGLTNLQSTYYKGIYGENRMVLAKFGTNSVKTSQLNNMDVQLRKCCNHLFLLKGVEEELTRECKSEEDLYNKLLESSGKLMLLDKFIEKFKKENHKMLIFSQFKRMLDIIELYLKMKGVPYEKLTGSVKTADRISAIQRFNDDKTPSGEGGGHGFGVFLLTTRAGGLGINLTSARVVIIFDSDWNPQNDLQAIARAHRIGQKFEVQVYRLITSKTYEEQMFERASKKLGMEQALFSKGAFHPGQYDPQGLEGGLQLRSLAELKQDSKEIENLLKYGAYAFMDGGDDEAAAASLKNKDIDEILATGKKKEFTYNKGVYTLQKSTFDAARYEKGLPDVNDPDFWNKALPFQTLISIGMLEKKFKKEKKEIAKSEKEQKEFIKDLEIAVNDFMDMKFDESMSVASRKQFEADEELLREMLKKMVKLSGMKLFYVEKCKEWLREMIRTSRRKKPMQTLAQADRIAEGGLDDEEEPDVAEEDDIIIDDSENDLPVRSRPVRTKRAHGGSADMDSQPVAHEKPKRGRKLKAKPPKETPVTVVEQNFDDNESDEEAKEELFHNDDDDDSNLSNPEVTVTQQRRSERAKKPKIESHVQQDYEPDDFNERSLGKSKPSQRRSVRQAQQQQVEEENVVSGDERYGLRGRRKRQRLDDSSQKLVHQQSSTSLLADLRPGSQLSKRNEKNGIVCAQCLKPETTESPCTWFCSGYCQRSFHEQCKGELFVKAARQEAASQGRRPAKVNWQCDDCLDNVAECFCCKKKGLILVFPKKGKPKAPGNMVDASPHGLADGGHMEGDNQEDSLGDESPVVKDSSQSMVDDLPLMRDMDREEQDDKPMEEAVPTIKQEFLPVKKEDEQVVAPEQCVDPSTPKPAANDKLDEEMPVDIKLEKEAKGEPAESGIDAVQVSALFQLELAGHHPAEVASEEPDANDPKYVVRCTLGGCFKYYHVKCVYKNKNVSCINSMKVQRFRCPLHYCEICQASGDSVLIVQCVACPTAYHVKCMPRGDPNAIRLTKKFVICRKHELNADDFPRFEEKLTTQPPQANTPQATSVQVPLIPQVASQVPPAPTPDGKPPPKKRGRKPKSHHIAQAEAAAAALAAGQAKKITEQSPMEEARLQDSGSKQWNQPISDFEEDIMGVAQMGRGIGDERSFEE